MGYPHVIRSNPKRLNPPKSAKRPGLRESLLVHGLLLLVLGLAIYFRIFG